MPRLNRTSSDDAITTIDPAASGAVDDAAIVARAKRDRQAFAPLYETYFDRIYAYCWRRLGTTDAAADATSLIFAKALAALDRCDDWSFRSWLFAIAHNVVTDVYRTHRVTEPLTAAGGLSDGSPTPEERLLATEERQRVRLLLGALSADQRAVVELRLSGLTGQEISAVLGKSRTAIDSTQHRAIARLRVLLGVESAPGRKGQGDDDT